MHNEDPRLTAYALGELEPPERAEIEALLKNDPAAAQEVAEMRELASLVRRHLSTEDAPPLAPQQRDDILSEMNGPQIVAMPRAQRGTQRRVWMPVAIAACAAVLAGSSVLYYEEHKPRKHMSMKELAETKGEESQSAFVAADERTPQEGVAKSAVLATDKDGKEGTIVFDTFGAANPTPTAPLAVIPPGNGIYSGATSIASGTLSTAYGAEGQVAPAPAKRALELAPAPAAPMTAAPPAAALPLPGGAAAGEAAKANLRDAQARGDLGKDAKDRSRWENNATDGSKLSSLAEREKDSTLDRSVLKPRPNAQPEQLVGNAGGAFGGARGINKQLGERDEAKKEMAEKAKNQIPQAAAPSAAPKAKVDGLRSDSGPANLEVDKLRSTLPRTMAGRAGGDEYKYSRHASVDPTAPGGAPAKPGDQSGADKREPMPVATKSLRRAGEADDQRALQRNESVPVAGAAPAPSLPGPVALASAVSAGKKGTIKGEKAAAETPDANAAAAAPLRKTIEAPIADASRLGLAVSDKELETEKKGKGAKSPEPLGKDGLGRLAPGLAAADAPESRTATPAPLPEPLESRAAALAPQPESLAPGFISEPFNTDSYDTVTDNPFLQVLVRGNETSTLSIDVDTASYSNVRRMLTAGQRPPRGAVRIEELVNYFKYDYPEPKAGDPMSVSMDVAACPWTPEHRLLRVGLKAREMDQEKRPQANLIFLIDVSGSMDEENKLPLVKKSLRLLVEQLGPQDTVGIAVYAGASGTVLEPTNEKKEILRAIDRLSAGGSTNGGAGIQLAYKLAAKRFEKGRLNRVILATDGDFNVGVTNQSDLVDLIQKQAKSGVFLTVLGFGYGNLKDSTMEKLADKGNGNYGYIDTIAEGRKMLVEQMAGTLVTVAKDVKLQIEFNPAQVGAYRLLGYENRLLAKEDFNDDTKDAGEIGAGHTVTALYELVPAGQPIPGDRETTQADPLKYQPNPIAPGNKVAQASVDAPRYENGRGGSSIAELGDTKIPQHELLTLKLRWKAPDAEVSTKREFPLVDPGLTLEKSSKDFRWAAAVAQFGMILRDSPYKGQSTWSSVRELAVQGQGKDADSHRIEFLELIGKAEGVAK